MRFAVIENQIVVNIVEADLEFASSQGWINADGIPNAEIGANYSDGVFTAHDDTAQKWANIRELRDADLKKSDIMVYPDRWNSMTQEQQVAWATYRQALRDLPESANSPDAVLLVWPKEPTNE